MDRLTRYIALAALFVSLIGNVLVWKVSHDADAQIKATGAERRTLVAESDRIMCHNIYSALYDTIKESRKEVTYKKYKAILPQLSDAKIKNLVDKTRDQMAKQLQKFDPDNCDKLPSQQPQFTGKPRAG